MTNETPTSYERVGPPPLTLGETDYEELERILSMATRYAAMLARDFMDVGQGKWPTSGSNAAAKAAWVVNQCVSHWLRMKQGQYVSPTLTKAR